MSPKVSIIIPTHNRIKFFRDCLNSVQFCNYENVETIVVDSSNDTYSKNIEKIITDEKFVRFNRSSLSAKRNFGVNCSDGDYILFLDSDDIIFPNILSKYIQKISKEKSLVCFSPWKLIDQHNSVLESDGADISKHAGKILLYTNIAPIHSYIFDRKLFNKVGYFNEELNACEDWEFISRITSNNFSLSYYNQVLAGYRMHNTNMTTNKLFILEESLRCIDIIHNYTIFNQKNVFYKITGMVLQFLKALASINTNFEIKEFQKIWISRKNEINKIENCKNTFMIEKIKSAIMNIENLRQPEVMKDYNSLINSMEKSILGNHL